MKKIISISLTVIMLAAMLCSGVSATILFQDPFDEWTSYWIGYNDPQKGGDKNELSNHNGENVLEGWDEARVHQAAYENDEEAGSGYASTRSSMTTGTVWVELMAEVTESDEAGAGLWWKNTYHEKHEGADDSDLFMLKYFPATSTVKFIRDFPGAMTDAERTLVEWSDPQNRGNNLRDPITLGFRIETGKISAYVDGQWIGSYDDATIGYDACPILLWNDSLHAIWDNYCVGDLNELPLPTNATSTTNNQTGDNSGGNGASNNGQNASNPGNSGNNGGTKTRIETTIDSEIVTHSRVIGVDENGNEITTIESEIVTVIGSREVADTDGSGSSANRGGSATGDAAVIVISVMIVALGSAIVVKKVSER